MRHKRIKNSKRGDGHVHSLILVIFAFIVLSAAAGLLGFKFSSLDPDKQIGDHEFELFDIYQFGENALFFIDTTSQLSVYQAIHDLSENGGYKKTIGEDGIADSSSGCGEYAGYALWNSENKDCFPYDVGEELKEQVNENINRYVGQFTLLDIPQNNYEISITESDGKTKFIGTAIKPIVVLQRLETSGSYLSSQEQAQIDGECPKLDLVLIPDSIECRQTSEPDCRVLPDVKSKLEEASAIAAKRGLKLAVTSAYRSFAAQKKLYDKYGAGRVATPSCTSPHTTGRAVDVVIVGGSGMGSANMGDISIGDRKLLEEVMCEAGFVRYDNEFWHFEFGTGRWQRGKGAGVCSIV